MMTWLLVIILAYLFFSFSFLGDKLMLVGAPTVSSAKPKLYVFYIGILSALVVVLIPFIPFGFPSQMVFVWIVLEALVTVVGLLAMFSALAEFEVSMVMVTIGAIQPIFILLLTWVFFGPQAIEPIHFLAFLMLLIGSIVISFKKKVRIEVRYVKIVLIASVMFSLDYVFSKLVYSKEPFLQGFIWMRIWTALFVLPFFLNANFRKELFTKQNRLNKRAKVLFLSTQASGGIANFLQSWAIYLVPVAFLPILNALRGLQYVFLFFLTLVINFFFGNILKEETSKGQIFQKTISIVIIFIGLALLSLY